MNSSKSTPVLPLLVSGALLLCGDAQAARGQCEAHELAKLVRSDGAPTEYFGSSVTLFGDTAMIGSLYNEGSGSVYVFRRDPSGWLEGPKVLPSDGAPGDRFGGSTALHGDAAVIGAYTADDLGPQSGSAYVFRFDGSSWLEETKLVPDDGEEEDWLGYSVALSGDVAVVGAPRDPFEVAGPVSGNGCAYVFRFDGSNWAQEHKLLASDGADHDKFGIAVALSGDAAVIGAQRDDDNGPRSGSAYVFRFDGSSWVEEAKLLASDGMGFAYFGCSVAISGDTVAIGAEGHGESGPWSGTAYVFRYDGSSWVQEARLLASDGAPSDQFGNTVAISDGTAVIGAHHEGGLSGAAYVFRFDGSNWLEEAKLLASDRVEGEFDRFGYSVAVRGDTALIGANAADDHGSSSGSAYVFGGLSDCNTNGTLDTCDIVGGTSEDANTNGIPDECEGVLIQVDVKPGSCPNPLNRRSHGVLPVALVGTEDFDVTQIDVSSVRLWRADAVGGEVAPHEGPPGPHSVFEDVATPFEGEACDCHDLAGDGIVDLLVKFKTDDVVEALLLDDLPAGALVELVVSGYLLGGTPFEASDCVRLVPPGTLPGVLGVQSSVTGAWIGVSPPDETLDGDGFTDFQRNFPLTTVVTLTAEEWAEGQPLRGWQIGGLLHHMGETTVEVTIDQDMTVSAVYGSTPDSASPRPDPTAPESFIPEETASGAGTIERP